MVSLDTITEPLTGQFLIAFADLRAFVRLSKSLGTSAKIFNFLDNLAHLMTETLDGSGGRILKFIGDSALIVYPGDDADAGVKQLLELKQVVDSHIQSEGHDSRLAVGIHVGEATVGPFGPNRRVDIFGESVNRAAVTERGARGSEFTITPEAFRRLEPPTRKMFRKHTPPVVYVTR